MDVLRRVLYVEALAFAILGLVFALIPGPALGLLGQPDYPDLVWVRIAGVDGFVLALLMVLVGHHAERAWWWSWAFVLATAGEALVATVAAALSLPPGTAVWPWWAFAALSWAFAAALLYGLARAGAEPPPV